MYIFLHVVTYESLPASLQSFKKTLKNHFEKSPGEVMVYDEQSSSSEEMLVKILGVNALLLMLCRL